MTRRDQILALLGSLFDLYPGEETWTGRLQRRALVERGPVASVRQPCELCEGRGRLRSLRPCTHCGGDPETGKPGRGYRMLDPYTGQEVRSLAVEAVPSVSEAIDELGADIRVLVVAASTYEVACDRCGGEGKTGAGRCHRCAGSGRRKRVDRARLEASLARLAESPPTDATEYVLDAIERRDRAGSFRALERCLRHLFERHVYRGRIVWAVHVAHTRRADTLTEREEVALEKGLVFLERAMPERLRVPDYALAAVGRHEATRRRFLHRGRDPMAERVRRERNAEIARRYEGGESVPELVRRFGVQRSQLYEILAADAAEIAELKAMATGAA